MKSRIVMVTLALALMVVAASANVPQWFGFLGQAIVPDDIGDMLSMYSIMYDPAPSATTPLPLDFANFEYTLVINNLELKTIGSTFVGNTYESAADGFIIIYEDNASLADYADQATFVDGTAILIGKITTLTHRISAFNPMTGTVSGLVNWIGGTRLDDIPPEYQTGWFLGDTISRYPEDVEPGYTEQWNGKVETEPFVQAEQHSLTAVKDLMR